MKLRPLTRCTVLAAVLLATASEAVSLPESPAHAADPSNESSSPSTGDKTGYRGSTGTREYVVYGELPGEENDSDSEQHKEIPDEEESSTRDQRGNNSGAGEAGETDPLKIYVGDPFSAEEGEAPENLCYVSPDGSETDSGCNQIMRQTCGPNRTVLSYELGDGTSTARCVSNDEVVQAIDELRGQEQESLPAEAHTAFTDLTLEPAVVKFEPDLLGFGYKGRHTNIYADVETQTVTQELLGETVELRATPQEFHWDYGDGTSRTTYEPGQPLADYDGTGQEIVKTDFATETSHVYEETGIYPVTVETVYTGQFRVSDGDWRDIPGTVSMESSPGEADIWTQNSRWVSGACESQDQWGCNGPVQFDPATDRPPKIYQDQYDENGRWIGPVN